MELEVNPEYEHDDDKNRITRIEESSFTAVVYDDQQTIKWISRLMPICFMAN